MAPNTVYVLLAQAALPAAEIPLAPMVGPVMAWAVLLTALAGSCAILWFLTRPQKTKGRPVHVRRPSRPPRAGRSLAGQQA